MPSYKLVTWGDPAVHVDDILLERDEETGEEVLVSVSEPSELTQEQYDAAATAVGKLENYNIIEIEAPADAPPDSPDNPDNPPSE